ncbi:MAG: hypothetical protein IJP31_01990 [Lachnospiraceae bacterium]|nr:hypothetical protein [Lachnospiraceae bacterium]
MAIGQIDLNNAMTRIQDFTTQKHNEDTRGLVEQNQLQNQFNKELTMSLRQVVKSEETEYQNKKFDAKEKGSNQYSGDGGKRRKKDQLSEGRVIPKTEGGFDVKI